MCVSCSTVWGEGGAVLTLLHVCVCVVLVPLHRNVCAILTLQYEYMSGKRVHVVLTLWYQSMHSSHSVAIRECVHSSIVSK